MKQNHLLFIGILGFLLFVIAKFVTTEIDSLQYIQMLLVFSYGILIPILLHILHLKKNSLFRWITIFHPVAFLFAMVAFLLPQGIYSTVSSFPWLLFTLMVALFGLLSFLSDKSYRNIHDISIHAGLLYISIGGVWMLLHRTGIQILHFKDVIVLLTAIHFHYAAVVTPIVFGYMGKDFLKVRPSFEKVYTWLMGFFLVGPLVIATGITYSYVNPWFEFLAVVEFVLPVIVLSVLFFVYYVPTIRDRAVKHSYMVTFLSLFISMAFALLYGLGHIGGFGQHGHHSHEILDIPLMVFVHGFVNAFGFSLFALVGLSILKRRQETLENK